MVDWTEWWTRNFVGCPLDVEGYDLQRFFLLFSSHFSSTFVVWLLRKEALRVDEMWVSTCVCLSGQTLVLLFSFLFFLSVGTVGVRVGSSYGLVSGNGSK